VIDLKARLQKIKEAVADITTGIDKKEKKKEVGGGDDLPSDIPFHPEEIQFNANNKLVTAFG
tara:strand:- start:458 stop:643 length:186 start_codon:yes stop_codon:yes gene_type:complete